jgi:hypothetical protein
MVIVHLLLFTLIAGSAGHFWCGFDVPEKHEGRGSLVGFRGLEAADALKSQLIGGLQTWFPGK